MKAILACLTIVLLAEITDGLRAQSLLTLTGGGNYSEYHIGTTEDHYLASTESYSSYCINASLKIVKPHRINFRLETSFLKKSLDLNIRHYALASDERYNLYANLYYLYFSVLPEFSFGNKIKFNVAAGPSIGILLQSSATGNGSYSNFNGTHWNRTFNQESVGIFASDIRLLGQLSAEFPLHNSLSLTLENSYGLGLLSSVDDLKSFDMALLLGLTFNPCFIYSEKKNTKTD